MIPDVPPPPPAFDVFIETAKPWIPLAGLVVIIPLIYLFFRGTWRELDHEAQQWRAAALARGELDLRPLVAMVTCALILTMQEYYGGRNTYEETVKPLVVAWDAAHHGVLHPMKYDELFGFAWWVSTRLLGYVFVPFTVWKIAFPKDSLLDMGLHTRGFLHHAWIYVLFLAFVLPAMWLVSRQPDFGAYYPFYKLSSRSWVDFLAWEAMYFLQFFALEIFFRGFWVNALRRSLGSGAIFAMAVPYCMIHYGKPYLEANGAIIAGIALGSLSMKTKSIYQGFLVHITVAGVMDWLALRHRNALPNVFWPPPDVALAHVVQAAPPHMHASSGMRVFLGVLAALLVLALLRGALASRRAAQA